MIKKKTRDIAYPPIEKTNYNLLVLGILVIGIALLTTSVSVIIYHNSGDIYLDRSRPDFLPDEEEVENQPVEDYKMSEDGSITKNTLKEFTVEYQNLIDSLNRLKDSYTESLLSDGALGISAPPTTVEGMEETHVDTEPAPEP